MVRMVIQRKSKHSLGPDSLVVPGFIEPGEERLAKLQARNMVADVSGDDDSFYAQRLRTALALMSFRDTIKEVSHGLKSERDREGYESWTRSGLFRLAPERLGRLRGEES